MNNIRRHYVKKTLYLLQVMSRQIVTNLGTAVTKGSQWYKKSLIMRLEIIMI